MNQPILSRGDQVGDMDAVLRLHRRNLEARRQGLPPWPSRRYIRQLRDQRKRDAMGIFSRPSTGDRMDLAQERRDRMRQSEAEKAAEQAAEREDEAQRRLLKYEEDLKRRYRDKK